MPLHNYKGLGVAALVAVLVFVLGILIGFFSKTFYGAHSGTCDSSELLMLTRDEDPAITATLLSYIDVAHFDSVYR